MWSAGLCSSAVEHPPCKRKVMGSRPIGGSRGLRAIIDNARIAPIMYDAEYGNGFRGFIYVDPDTIGKTLHRMSPQAVRIGCRGIRVASHVPYHCLNIVEEVLDLTWCDILVVRSSLANVLNCERGEDQIPGHERNSRSSPALTSAQAIGITRPDRRSSARASMASASAAEGS